LKALIETSRRAPERVFLVGLELKSRTTWDLQDSLAELEELAATAGYQIESTGQPPLLRYVLATRPEHEARP